jgi:hypothetical protein
MATAFSGKAITSGFVANKKQYSCWFLLILWVLQIAYSYVLNDKNGGVKQFVTLTKAMQILTDLHTKLLKTVTVKVHQSNYNRKGFLESAKVVKDGGEGWLFLLQAGARKQLKKPSWSHWHARWPRGCFT